MEPVRIDIAVEGLGARQLVCNPWPYKVGRRWIARFVKLLAVGVSSDQEDVLATVMDRVSDDMLEELLDVCEQHTAVVDGNGVASPFSSIAPLLQARYDIPLQLAKAHVELNFAPSFASLATVLGGPSGAAKAKTAGGAPSS